jgi:hypothetical protein
MEERLAATGPGIYLLRQTPEPNPAAIESSHQLDQGSKGTAQPIEPSDEEDITLPGVLKRSGKVVSIGLGATGRIPKDLRAPSGL